MPWMMGPTSPMTPFNMRGPPPYPPIQMFQPPMPLQMMQPIDNLPENEKTIPTLPQKASISAFLQWQQAVLGILYMIPNFDEDMLDEPRDDINFDPSLPESHIDRLYKIVWMRLKFGISNVCETVASIANV